MPETLQPDPKRWTALTFIALAQLMVVLDATVVNIALPSAQADLGISDGNRQWVVTAYTLAFGGLLLFGGRVSDLWGRKNTFIVGLLGFAAASALGGAAVNTAMLLGARALQGLFGALLAPAALSLLAVMFTDAKERAKAFGVYGAIAGAGAAVGLILGGVLTEYLNWRWALFVNIAFAIIAVIGAVKFVNEPAQGRNHNRLDIPGVVLASVGLVALVYGFSRAESAGWASASTISLLVASVLLLAAFAFVESRVKAPLLPLRVVTDRNRGGVYSSLGLAIIGMFGLFLFLTYYLQTVMGYSALKSGVAFLPMVGGMIVGSTQIGTRLMLRVRPRLLMAPGFLVAAIGMGILAQIKVDSNYAEVLLPGLILMGLGMGTAFMPAMSLATHGVRPEDSGVASAMVNTSQQVGGSIGTALLNTLAASATASWIKDRATGAGGTKSQLLINEANVHGYSVAIYWATGILAVAALLAFFLVNAEVQNHAERADGDESIEDFAIPVIAH
ncbi:drug resistance transporter, EmrB/QacA subfamily [Streptomyces sp. DvalAA-14]|uniref:MFS transporter n=1 Tax=unclassified Streptomyces TaxID=2593676 RepID=UPI00081B569F|nr:MULTISPECIES: MFS transporter [unclassified Streptomyces]MYS21346.1 DHA2 family efflux MFS transporter permease subunit [Streptomyces sp. SID4948]SCD90264.1 drug resistance transporter, EmrB/QacA subfamily [Streptomyces sp. DvalAA-14]